MIKFASVAACAVLGALVLWVFYEFYPRPSLDRIKLGHYDGTLIFKPLDDGRMMEVMEPFGYVDGLGIAWAVPKGVKVDGASIPRSLWSIVGGPFEGKYREASVVHDFFCNDRSRNWEATHRVFYEAMLASKVDEKQAQLLFYAVYRFGPRWTLETNFSLNHSTYSEPIRTVYEAKFDPAELEEVARQIQAGDVSLDKLTAEARGKREAEDTLLCKYASSVEQFNCIQDKKLPMPPSQQR